MTEFDPNGAGRKGSLFGLPYSTEESDLIIVPVPWEVTASYGGGSSDAPSAILEASTQVDHTMDGLYRPWEMKMAFTWSWRGNSPISSSKIEPPWAS